MAEKKSKKKSKLKEFIGPVAVTPNVRKQETIDGKNKSSNTGGGITLDTKFGTITLDKDNNISSYDGGKDYKTDTKKITYGKDFDTKFGIFVIVNINTFWPSMNNSGVSPFLKFEALFLTIRFFDPEPLVPNLK